MTRQSPFFSYQLCRRVILLVCTILVLSICRAEGMQPPTEKDITRLDIEQLMEIEVESVYGASKFEQKVTEAPSSISVITASDIKQYGYRTLADALQSVRGFYVSGDESYGYLGSRGFLRPGDYNTRFLLLINGHRVNDNIYDTANIGNELPLDIDLVEKIEIIRGPGSSIYGSNAFFGVINIVTRNGNNIKGMEISGEVSRYRAHKERVTYGNKIANGPEMLLSVSHLAGKGQSFYFKEYDSPETNYGKADSNNREKSGNAFMNLRYKGFSLEGSYVSRSKENIIGTFGTNFNDNRTDITDQRGYIDARYAKDIGLSTKLSVKAFYDYYHYEGDYIYENVLNKDFSTGKWWGTGAEISTMLGEKHKFIAGFEYQDNIRQWQRTYDENPYMSYLNDDRSSYSYAFYAQDQFSIFNNLIINAGVRYDHYKVFGDTVNPRVGIIYNPWKRTTLKFLYGMAFRAPNAYELYYGDGGNTQKANPDLNPEKIQTYEIVAEQYFKHYRFAASAFYYRMKDMIGQQTDPVDNLIVFRNIDEAESKGIGFEMQGKWKHVEGQINYSYQHTTDGNGRQLTNSPKHLAALNVRIPIMGEQLSTGIEVRYIGPRKTLAGKYTGGGATANVTFLSREIIKGLEVSGSIYNLLDKKICDPASGEFRQDTIPREGRSGRIKIVYRF